MNKETALKLQRLRKEKGLSQEELADKLGVSRQAVSKWERGEASPDTDNLILLAKLYGVSIDELLRTDSDEIKDDDPVHEEEKNDEEAKNGDKVHIGFDGIHVEKNDGTYVHIDGFGIRVKENGNKSETDKKDDDPSDEEFHQFADSQNKNRTKGIHVDGADGTYVHIDNSGIHVNGKKKEPSKKARIIKGVFDGFIFLLCIVGYILIGSLCSLWHPGWLIFFIPPILGSLYDAIMNKNASDFAFPVLIAGAYLYLGCVYSLWHPYWVIILLIPIYYITVNLIKKAIRLSRTAKNCNAEFFADGDGIKFTDDEGNRVNIGKDGINFSDNENSVHMDFEKSDCFADGNGIHFTDDEGNSVHVGNDGVNFNDGKKSVHINLNDAAGLKYEKARLLKEFMNGLICLLTLTAYILLGAVWNLWHPGWLIFFLIPVLCSLTEAIFKKNAYNFAYPVLVAGVYLLLGFTYSLWHLLWVIFLTIPVYYSLIDLIKKLALKDE